MRHLIGLRRSLAAAIILMALMARLLVPAGYMPVAGGSTLTICTGQGMLTIVVPTPADRHQGAIPEAGGGAAICDYAPLGLMATGAGELPQLYIASVAVLVPALLLLVAQPSLSSPFLRPPLRAPPQS